MPSLALASGARLGPYQIVSAIGAGGMGEVYKATDTRLNRTVAIKVLPADFANDDERRQRFEREARLVASLSHPQICAVHDVGRESVAGSTPVSYLVMEYLEGETLAERLGRGALPLADTFRLGADIASALAAAHREHIVHRDLKPANVMLTRSGVKLLDFGIAKAVAPKEARVDGLSTKALTLATVEGTTLGTLPYMSPEQVEGRPVDWRSDIFALGAVLYEMATGQRAFTGDSYAAVAASILNAHPPQIAASSALDRIVRGCLERDPDRRWQSAHDVGLQLAASADRDTGAHPAAASPRRSPSWILWAVAAASLIVAAIAVVVDRRDATLVAPSGLPGAVTFPMPPPRGGERVLTTVEGASLAVSPDGSKIAFISAPASGPARVWVRAFSALDAAPLAGTDGAGSVFWSPDSRSVAFFADGQLKRVEVAGGTPVVICRVRQLIGQTGTWGEEGTILFGSVQGEGIFAVPASGGTPVERIKPDAGRREVRVVWPSFLPGRSGFLYLATLDDGAGTIMVSQPHGSPREVARVKSNVRYVEPGYLLFVQDGTLIARRFELATGELSGDPVAVADPVNYFYPTGVGHFSASFNGVVAYQSHRDLSRIAWFDATGRESSPVRPAAGGYQTLRLSSDGARLLFERTNPRTNAHDIYLMELARGAEIQLTSAPGSEVYPLWGPEETIIYARSIAGPPRLARQPLHGGAEEALGPLAVSALQQATDISRDGKWVLYSERSAAGDYDIHALQLPDKKVSVLRNTAFNEVDARFSPDGRHVAFLGNDAAGRANVYLMPFASPGSLRPVSTDGGSHPRWSADGQHLYFISYASDAAYMMKVPITFSPSPEIGTAVRLFALPGRRWMDYFPAADGRFLAIEPVQSAGDQPLTILMNWRPDRN